MSEPLTWMELARMAGMHADVGRGEYFWRVQMLEIEEDCYRTQVVVRSVPYAYALQIDPLQSLLPAYRDLPTVGVRCTEETDQHSPRQDPR